MKAVAAIIEPAPIDTDAIAEQIRTAQRQEREADNAATKHEQLGADARAARKLARAEIAKLLLKARGAWPTRGPNAKGWGQFLSSIGMAESTARMYIDEARDPAGFAEKRRLASAKTQGQDDDQEPEQDDDGQFGPRIVPDPERPREASPFRAMTADDIVQALGRLPPEDRKRVLREGKANVAGGSGEKERGTWCTPKALALAVGSWDLDPFSNPRSHILAANRCMLENSGDGFGDGSGPGSYRVANRAAEYAGPETRVWIQPPYERQFVVDVVDHYKHTRFCALLRWSPDVVGWFARLWPRVAVVAFPRGERVAFEPPPGLEDKAGAGSPHSHALYYADERDVTDEVRAMCIVWRVEHDETTNTTMETA